MKSAVRLVEGHHYRILGRLYRYLGQSATTGNHLFEGGRYGCIDQFSEERLVGMAERGELGPDAPDGDAA